MDDDFNVFATIDDFVADDSIDIPASPQILCHPRKGDLPIDDDILFSPLAKNNSSTSREKELDPSASGDISSDEEVSPVKNVKSPAGGRRKTKKNVDIINSPLFKSLFNDKPKKGKPLAPRQLRARKPVEVIEIPDEDEPSAPASNYFLETAFDEENAVIMIKVNWEFKLQKIPLRRHQQFQHLCEVLAKQSGKDADTIVLTMNDQIVNHTDTPDTVKYNIGKFIYARSMDQVIERARKDTTIELKVQSDVWKKPILVRIEPTQKMKVLVILCAEQLKRSPTSLRFKFDGEFLDMEATPEDLELEGGELLDLRIVEC